MEEVLSLCTVRLTEQAKEKEDLKSALKQKQTDPPCLSHACFPTWKLLNINELIDTHTSSERTVRRMYLQLYHMMSAIGAELCRLFCVFTCLTV